ncbi:UDP-N-acetylmuramoyl-L-alanine--D-glutamate ligase [Venatoribacter cucullus]|uniref:UDP-N-acetylmuramoylalanine--D-glutamate ligase n=1 Tax=Venatoribacter cucullus TaxID=2661630 RepID=A0A9X7UXI6_9GAMM|nr:UDP-N-acetylmuramoyl-L-alanine--D-glutamate ligase [Venatoribacter cucullus]QQD24862.1 UDP-N-acetylmuramoyl-L-alanine--D-glutamate ligase [Venatoribacter cucullus]
MTAIHTINKRMIVGLGMTGLSAARWCQRQGYAFDLCDTRTQVPGLAAVKAEFPRATIFTGPLQADILSAYDQLIVSPGVAIHEPAIQAAAAAGAEISGDVQLFAERCQQPIIAITGSNGKSTVTTLVGELLAAAGKQVAVGGNIGVPVLDLPAAEIYVLELSSFQLETTRNLNAAAAVILNLSEDHLDRYDGMAGYLQAKQRIFQGCRLAVVNRDDAATSAPAGTAVIRFGLDAPVAGAFGLQRVQNESWIVLGEQPVIAASELKIKGQHNLANVMAALALVQAVGVAPQTVLPALRQFAGLEHRCQWLGQREGVSFYNDSKGTNVGSTLAAINGLGPEINGKIWLLAGGEGKGQDFKPLADSCHQYAAAVLTFGADGGKISAAVNGHCPTENFATLDDAFATALQHAQNGDVILLSPACASFDQFRNYVQRGEYFRTLVEAQL